MFYVDYLAGKKVVKSDLLKGVTHFFTTRDSCIFSKDEDMSENRKLIEAFLEESMATNQPVHGVHIEQVSLDKKFYENTDGLVIKNRGAAYMNFADCTPVILFCDKTAMIVHAGWRGTAQGIAKIAFEKMTREYGYLPENIKIVIGPAICMDCYEVGEEVFRALFKTVAFSEKTFNKKGGRFYVDLKGINKQQLVEAGAKQIDVCPYCTACGEKLFFSYRHENQTGYRHSAIMKLP